MRLNFVSDWKSEINNSKHSTTRTENKLRTYALFKDCFVYEPFLYNVHNCKDTFVLTKIGISAHNLAIETGRHARPNMHVKENTQYVKMEKLKMSSIFLLRCICFNNIRAELNKSGSQLCRLFEMQPINFNMYYPAKGSLSGMWLNILIMQCN